MSCPLCGDARPARHELRAHDTDLVRCRRCGLVRVDPLPSAEEAATLYDDGYFRDAERGYVDYRGDDAVFRTEFRRRLATLQRAGARGRLLDVGCATGGLLLEARALGFEPSGIEPAADTAREAAERSGCAVLAAPLQDALLAPSSFRVITLFDVLEHLTDPRAALRRLGIALEPGGLLAVTVPNYGGLWARVSGRRWPFLTPWEHLVYYTRRTLRAMLTESGLVDVTFHPARTPVSFGTLAHKAPWPASLAPRRWKHRGLGLPFGTLFAVGRARPASGRARD